MRYNQIVMNTLGLLLVVNLFCICYGASDVVTENLKLYVDGREFFIKAMCYNPAPLGQAVVTNGVAGGGFCSPKKTPFGTTTTTCYDSDYFDGGGDAADRVQPTEGGWFQPLWRRDFPIIKSLGANTLRLYNANPTTKQASIYYPEVVTLPLGKDHVPFMDMAHEHGFKVIFPLISDYGMLTTYAEDTFKRLLRWQIDELGNHPALLMWGFGNELPLHGNQFLIDILNLYITYIKQYTWTKWGRKVPLTTAVVDLPMSYDYLAETLDVDIFTTNAGYRGFTFTDLWTGNAMNQGWHKLSCRYNKPVFIGEINWHSLNNAITYEHPDWFNQIWKDLVDHIDQGCIGGAFFEYSDERLKEDALQQTMGVVRFEVNTTGGRPSTQAGVWNVDVAVPKDIIFEAVKSGTYKGKFYNMVSSPFNLVERSQTQLGSSNNICSAFGYVDCPGKNTCSFRGKCDRQRGVCACNTGWTGADCSQVACTNNCNGRGTCVGSVSPPVCTCQEGWTGPACAVQATQATCASSCVAGNGKCDTNGKCVCNKGWWGHNCGIPDISYPPSSTSEPPLVLPTTAPKQPTQIPSSAPTQSTPATTTPTSSPTTTPTSSPTTPTKVPTNTPTSSPATKAPTSSTTPPTTVATKTPTTPPTIKQPTQQQPTRQPTQQQPTRQPTQQQPTQQPTQQTTTQPSSQCGALQSCGGACYNPQSYTCFDNFLCPIPTKKCGNTCYDATIYNCNSNNQLVPK